MSLKFAEDDVTTEAEEEEDEVAAEFREAAAEDAGNSCEPSNDAAACAPGQDGYYAHPLQGVEPIDGSFPFLDLHLSPSGKAYALMEGGHGLEDGTYSDFGPRLVEVERLVR